MKKILSVFLVSLLVLTGCGQEKKPVEEGGKDTATSKTLTCHVEQEEDGMKFTEKYVFNFDAANSLTKVNYTYTNVLDETTSEYYSDMLEELKMVFELSEDIKGVTIEVKGNDKDTIDVIMNANYLEMDQAAKDEMSLDVAEGTYDSVKSFYVENGYTCE